ncbi:thiol-disulfide oxidoreductase DCC family protein [Zhouia sp. PK063]|uniref:thiol-disulfide oxidoreductase DCC family protein n=1 Tax=Zhouia sp. PK063 TaxID=3373602 RepID=UPI0037A46B4D
MFKNISHTQFPPSQPTLVWDGHCGFCKYWKTKWQLKTKGKVVFVPYQNIAHQFKDIPLKEFKKASKLIEPNGTVYNGPNSAYRSIWYAGNKNWHTWYSKYYWFKNLSNHGYNHIAKNRHFYYKLTVMLFGKNPLRYKSYWFWYLIIFIAIITFVI